MFLFATPSVTSVGVLDKISLLYMSFDTKLTTFWVNFLKVVNYDTSINKGEFVLILLIAFTMVGFYIVSNVNNKYLRILFIVTITACVVVVGSKGFQVATYLT